MGDENYKIVTSENFVLPSLAQYNSRKGHLHFFVARQACKFLLIHGFSFLRGVVKTFNELADHLMMRLREKADGTTTVPLLDYFAHTTLDAIGKVQVKWVFRKKNLSITSKNVLNYS